MKHKKTELKPSKVFKRYSEGIGFNARINLDHEVEENENFFVGK